MEPCFIFADSITEQGAHAFMPLDDGVQGHKAYAFYTFDELRKQTKIILVEQTHQVSIFEVKLPKLSDQKARAAIPYALEEQLAQSIESLHFSFDSKFYNNGCYLVIVIDKSRIQMLAQLFDDQNIQIDTMTIDWFALPDSSVLNLPAESIIKSTEYNGSLPANLAPQYCSKHPEIETINHSESIEASRQWTIDQLQKGTFLNLLQGQHAKSNKNTSSHRYLKWAAVSILIWIGMVFSINFVALYQTNQHLKSIDGQIATIYKQFFPDAKYVVSPRFRIEQLLKKNSTGQSEFWRIINQLSTSISDNQIDKIDYANNKIRIRVSLNDFKELEQLKTQLTEQGLSIKQTQATTENGFVIADLELQ